MLTEEQKNHSHGLKIDLFCSICIVGESPNIPKITNRIFSAVLARLLDLRITPLLTRGETAEASYSLAG